MLDGEIVKASAGVDSAVGAKGALRASLHACAAFLAALFGGLVGGHRERC